jgi:coenzyme F420-0:L-glutamate ligase/coenzyme F420-1:gamma-L-glutamate ligase
LAELRVLPLEGLPEIPPGADLASLFFDAARSFGGFEDDDVLVIAQKAVSKAEGRVVALDDVVASAFARSIAGGNDPRKVEVTLREAARIVRVRPPLVIAQTRHGFVCASAGVDQSNVGVAGTVVLLPVDPDASAAGLRGRLEELTGARLGVIVSDSFGRPLREGLTEVAIGVSGLVPLLDLRGSLDRDGYELHATQIAVADEIAAAAELVMGKADGVPAAVVRGLHLAGEGTASQLVMSPERDLFR